MLRDTMRNSAVRKRRPKHTAMAACLVLPALGIGLCEGGPHLATRTFELQYLNPHEAAEMIAPYVYEDRDGAAGVVTAFSGGITVRETPEALDRIAEVIELYDRAKPGVRLRFQIIEANGFAERDDRIADVQAALDELFRFEGYRLVTEAQFALMEGASSTQFAGDDSRPFEIHGEVQQVRGSGDRGSVVLAVQFRQGFSSANSINTTLTVPVGQTVVLGSTRGYRSESTMILTVRPEFVPLPDSVP